MKLIDPKSPSNLLYMSDMAFEQMQRIPTIDAEPVVRCRYCLCSFMANAPVELNGVYLCRNPKGLRGKLDLDMDYCCHGKKEGNP